MIHTAEYVPTAKEIKLNELKLLLEELIELEDYPNCIKVRDKIKKLEKE